MCNPRSCAGRVRIFKEGLSRNSPLKKRPFYVLLNRDKAGKGQWAECYWKGPIGRPMKHLRRGGCVPPPEPLVLCTHMSVQHTGFFV